MQSKNCSFTKLTKKERNNIVKTYEKGDDYKIIDPELGILVCNVYNNLKQPIISTGEDMSKKELEQFKNDILNAIAKSETKRSEEFEAYKIELQKQRQQDRQELKNEILDAIAKSETKRSEEFEAYKIELQKQRKEDKKEILSLIQQNEERRIKERIEDKKEFEAYKIELQRQRKEDKKEFNDKIKDLSNKVDEKFNYLNNKIETLDTLIKTNHIEVTNRLDRIEKDVEMLKSFHEEDIKKYKLNNSSRIS